MHRVKGHFLLKNFVVNGERDGSWVCRKGQIHVASLSGKKEISLSGTLFQSPKESSGGRKIGVAVLLNGRKIGSQKSLSAGDFTIRCSLPAHRTTALHKPEVIELKLTGVTFVYLLAVLNEVLGSFFSLNLKKLEKYKSFEKSRQIVFTKLFVDAECVLNFGRLNHGFLKKFVADGTSLGFNLIGWYHGYLGIGESVRLFDRACASIGIPADNINMRLNLDGAQSKELWNKDLVKSGNQEITLIHADAPQSFDVRKRHSKELSSRHYKIGYWAWELSEFPDGWVQYASVFDEIWCPSDFCREAMCSKLPCPVITMPHSIHLDIPDIEQIELIKTRFNLPQNKFLFLFIFDINSYIERKNPFACVKAYQAACKSNLSFRNNTGIVIKLHGASTDSQHLQELIHFKEGIEGLQIINETLTRTELTALECVCDCFVSLHRAEGFGLSVAECMYLGKPVISTNWSATTEFLSMRNGCPVDFRLVQISDSVGPYTQGQYWAEPDIDHASRWMIELFDDPDLARKLGKRAQKDIEEHLSPLAIGKRYKDRLGRIALF